jgi:hypothetical protein
MNHRLFPLPCDRDNLNHSQYSDAGALDVVWGVPSDEMLQSERDGHIVLVQDLSRRFPPRLTALPAVGQFLDK